MEPTMRDLFGDFFSWTMSEKAANFGTFLMGLGVLLGVWKAWTSFGRWKRFAHMERRAECAVGALTLLENYRDVVIEHIHLSSHHDWLEWTKEFERIKKCYFNPAYAQCRRLGDDAIKSLLQDIDGTLRAMPCQHRQYYDNSFGLTGEFRAGCLHDFNAGRSLIEQHLDALSILLANVALIRS